MSIETLKKLDTTGISGRMGAYTFKMQDNEITVPSGPGMIHINEYIRAFASCQLNREQQATLKQFFLHFNAKLYFICDDVAAATNQLTALKNPALQYPVQAVNEYTLPSQSSATFKNLSFTSSCLEFETTHAPFEFKRAPVEIKYKHVFNYDEHSTHITYTRSPLSEQNDDSTVQHIRALCDLDQLTLLERAMLPQADKSLSFKPPALLGFMSLIPPVATEVLETLHVYGAQHFLIPDLSLIFLAILGLVLSTLIQQIQSLKYLLHTSIALLFSASTLQLLATLGYITFNHVVLPFDMIAVGLAIFGLSCTLLWETYSRNAGNPTLSQQGNDQNSTNERDMAQPMAPPPPSNTVLGSQEAPSSRSATQLTS